MEAQFLTKPPFRFLHDIVTALIKSQGFPVGLYSPEELDSGNFKDKEAKMGFLTKLMACVGVCTGTAVEARESKVVAGLEPEKTNQLLQALAQAAKDGSIDRAEAVRLALAGAEPSPETIPRFAAKGEPSTAAPPQEEEEEKIAAAAPKEVQRQAPPASRGGQRGRQGLGGDDAMVAAGAKAGGLDDKIEACDGSPELTRTLLEPLLVNKKPKLSDKLLNKPPFRFLHDLISEVVRSTGFARGLYDEVEADSSQVVDKEAKIKYLAKIIKVVGMQLNTIVEARPQKIVSGLEASNTNRFLQLLAIAASELPESSANVRAVVDEFGGTAEAKEQPEAPGKPSEPEVAAAKPEPAKPVPEVSEPIREPAAAKDEEPPVQHMVGTKEAEELALTAGDFASSEQKKSVRPTTARRRPPRYKARTDEADSKDAAPKTTPKIFVDGAADDDDDDENNNDDDEAEDDRVPLDLGGRASDAVEAEAKSKLTRDIQEEERQRIAKKAAAAEKEAKSSMSSSGGGIRFGRIDRAGVGTRNDHVVETDLGELQATVQLLCQNTNPLGKCMDYIHEDISAMAKELEKWQKDYRSQFADLEKEQQLSAETLDPLHRKIRELDELIDDEKKKTRKVQNRIRKQELRINELLHVTCTASF